MKPKEKPLSFRMGLLRMIIPFTMRFYRNQTVGNMSKNIEPFCVTQ